MILTKAEILRRMELECPELAKRVKLDFSDPATCQLLELVHDLQAEAVIGRTREELQMCSKEAT
jgi:hypothetical protein